MDAIERIDARWDAIYERMMFLAAKGDVEQGVLDKEIVDFVVLVLREACAAYDDLDQYFRIIKYVRGFAYRFLYGPNVDDFNFLQYSDVDFRQLYRIPHGHRCDREVLEELLAHFESWGAVLTFIN